MRDQRRVDDAGRPVGKLDDGLAQAVMFDLPKHRSRVGEDLHDRRADDREEGIDDVPAVVERRAAALSVPRTPPRPVLDRGLPVVALRKVAV